MTFKLSTFVFEICNFIVLAFILYRLFYRPLSEAVERRRVEDEQAKQEAELAKKQLADAKLRYEEQLAQADRERQTVLNRAVEEAEEEKKRRRIEAEEVSRDIRKLAEQDTRQLRQDILKQLESELRERAVELAGRLLHQACDADLQSLLVQQLIQQLRGLTPKERESIRPSASTGSALIESAKPLSAEDKTRLVEALQPFLTDGVSPRFELRPELLLGARLQLDGHVWDASAAAQFADLGSSS